MYQDCCRLTLRIGRRINMSVPFISEIAPLLAELPLWRLMHAIPSGGIKFYIFMYDQYE